MSQARKTRQSNRGSVSQHDSELEDQPDSPVDAAEQEVAFKLSFLEALDDDQVCKKLVKIMKSATSDLVQTINSLRDEVRSLKTQVADRDNTIAQMKDEIQELRYQNDALEQYGRRNCLRITGISDAEEDSTATVVTLANEVLKIDPPIDPRDINNSHRLPKPRNAPADQPHPIIVRFTRKVDRDRVLKGRKELKNFNEDKLVKTYINEDLTTTRARLFAAARAQQKSGRLQQVWTFNGNVKVKTLTGVVKDIRFINDINGCLTT